MIETILTSAIWAPSGNNLQPWRFCVISEDSNLLKQISALTVYNTWVKTVPCLIAVFLDSKDAPGVPKIHMKHSQAIGAAIQNVLLTATLLGLGICWIGEIIKNEATLKNMLKVPSGLELIGVITLGYPSKNPIRTKRKNLGESILCWK